MKVVDLAATADLLPELEAQAAERLGDYRLAWWTDPAPEEHLASLAAAMSRFVEEIPLGDLDLRARRPGRRERLREREARRAAQRREQLTVVALAPSGEVAGYTDLEAVAARAAARSTSATPWCCPTTAATGSAWPSRCCCTSRLRSSAPGAELVATGNATTNSWMNAVNEQLGYRPVDRILELQKVLS